MGSNLNREERVRLTKMLFCVGVEQGSCHIVPCVAIYGFLLQPFQLVWFALSDWAKICASYLSWFYSQGLFGSPLSDVQWDQHKCEAVSIMDLKCVRGPYTHALSVLFEFIIRCTSPWPTDKLSTAELHCRRDNSTSRMIYNLTGPSDAQPTTQLDPKSLMCWYYFALSTRFDRRAEFLPQQ